MYTPGTHQFGTVRFNFTEIQLQFDTLQNVFMLSGIFHIISYILEGEILQACYQKYRSNVSTLLRCPLPYWTRQLVFLLPLSSLRGAL